MAGISEKRGRGWKEEREALFRARRSATVGLVVVVAMVEDRMGEVRLWVGYGGGWALRDERCCRILC